MGHKGPVTSMAMSPDGKYLASAGRLINLLALELPYSY